MSRGSARRRQRRLASACAAICAVAAGPAFAQSNVTLYGVVDLSLSRTSTGSGVTLPGGSVPGPASAKVSSLDAGVGYGSRIGFRGNEDLGGGLRGVFVLEMGLAPD